VDNRGTCLVKDGVGGCKAFGSASQASAFAVKNNIPDFGVKQA